MSDTTKFVVLSAWISRIISALSGLFALRILNAQLPSTEFAVYIVLIGVSGWFGIFGDPGIGYSTQNQISRKFIKKEKYEKEVLTAYILLFSFAIAICLLIYPIKNIAAQFLFDKTIKYNNNLGSIFWFSSVIISFGVAFSVSNKFLYAIGKGYIGNIIGALGSVCSLLILQIGIEKFSSKIMYAILAVNMPSLLLSAFLAIRQIILSWSSRRLINLKFIELTMGRAYGFFIFNVIAAGVVQIDYLIMSQKIEPIEIVQYYNLAKIFAIIAVLNQAILYALWPKFTMHFSDGKFKLIESLMLKVSLYTAIFTAVVTFILAESSTLLHLLYSSSEVIYRKSVIYAFGFALILRCLVDPYAIFLQSIDDTKPLIKFVAIQAPICIILQWFLSSFWSIEGILCALAFSSLATVSWLIPLEAKRKLN